MLQHNMKWSSDCLVKAPFLIASELSSAVYFSANRLKLKVCQNQSATHLDSYTW